MTRLMRLLSWLLGSLLFLPTLVCALGWVIVARLRHGSGLGREREIVAPLPRVGATRTPVTTAQARTQGATPPASLSDDSGVVVPRGHSVAAGSGARN